MESKQEELLLYTQDDIDYLHTRWISLTTNQMASTATSGKYWALFNNYYLEPQRYYHNFFHLRKLYTFLDTELSGLDFNNATFEYCLWFHDVIYDPQRKDNEVKSADLFKQYASESVEIDPEQAKIVEEIILATINHQMPPTFKPETPEWTVGALFLDADLSVLGWEPYEIYQKYAFTIWKEYEYFGREKYCEGRSAVLDKMLSSRMNLYYHPKIRESYEARARSNVKAEIASLQAELQVLRKTVTAILK